MVCAEKMSGDEKKIVSRAASGFAHQQGGVLVCGVETRKRARRWSEKILQILPQCAPQIGGMGEEQKSRRKVEASTGHLAKWRRERDSNPRYGFPYSGFQDIWIEVVLSRIRRLEAGGEGPKSGESALIRQLLFPTLFPRSPDRSALQVFVSLQSAFRRDTNGLRTQSVIQLGSHVSDGLEMSQSSEGDSYTQGKTATLVHVGLPRVRDRRVGRIYLFPWNGACRRGCLVRHAERVPAGLLSCSALRLAIAAPTLSRQPDINS